MAKPAEPVNSQEEQRIRAADKMVQVRETKAAATQELTYPA